MTVTEAEMHARIQREKHMAAMEVQTEAWADGISEGIDPEIMAAAGMETILAHLVRDCGSEAARDLLSAMASQLDAGHFNIQEWLH
jgi:hypothetical protein